MLLKIVKVDKRVLLLTFFVSSLVFSKTTVSLEDQCNCEVLSGVEVNSPGMTSPTGADIGDIYVNTNTGIIYFLDNNSWELTSSDSQEILDFNYNTTTRVLSLEIENAGPVQTITLPVETVTSISDANDGNITYTNEIGIGQVVSKSNLTDNLNGTYEFDNGNGTPITFDGTDNQNSSEVPLSTTIDVDEGGESSPTLETNVQEVIQAIAPITSKAARVFYPPSIAIDASTAGDNRTIDLYQEYVDQFGSPTAVSAGAPNALPTYSRTEFVIPHIIKLLSILHKMRQEHL